MSIEKAGIAAEKGAAGKIKNVRGIQGSEPGILGGLLQLQPMSTTSRPASS